MRTITLYVAIFIWVISMVAMSAGPVPSSPPPSSPPTSPTPPAPAPPANPPTSPTPTAPPAAAPATPPTPAESLLISDIHIVGNKRITALQIVQAFGMKPGDAFKPSAIQEGLERINHLGYFFEDKTTYESGVTDKGVLLTLHVEELPVLTRVTVLNSHVLKDDDVVRLMSLKPGEILNWNDIHKGIDAVNAELTRRGYPTPQFFGASADVNAETGELTVSMLESRIESIEIQDNHKTRKWVLMSQIHSRPGDYLNSSEIQKDAYRLGNLGILEDLPEVGVRSGSKPGWVVIVFKVKEAKTGRFTFGAGYGQTTGFSVTGSLSESNWRGLAQTLSASLSVGSHVNTYDLSFRNPLFRGTHDVLSLEAFRSQDILDFRNTVLPGNPTTRYTTTQTGGSVLVDHPFRKVYTFTYGADSRDQKLHLSSGTDLSKGQKQKEGLTSGRIDSVSLGLARDTRLDKYDSFQGARTGLDSTLGFKFLGANFDYSRYILDLRRYIALTKSNRWVAAGRLRTGFAFGNVPATDQFYMGGTDTVRGYEFGHLRGFKMGMMNLELRYRAQPVGGVLFLDAGDAGPNFATDSSGNLVQQKLRIQNTIWGAGAGIRFKIPQLSNLPVRLDLGYNFEKGSIRFAFGFGQLF